jgi:uncharacterized protein DUF3592
MQHNTWPGTGPPAANGPRRRSSPKLLLLVGTIFGVVGLVLLGVCTLLVLNAREFRSTAVATTGTVVGYETHYDTDEGRRSETYSPVVRFTAPDGRQVEVRTNVSSSRRPRVGEQVKVLYQPDDPQDARIDTATTRLVGPLVTGGLGGIFAVVAAVLFVAYRRSARR